MFFVVVACYLFVCLFLVENIYTTYLVSFQMFNFDVEKIDWDTYFVQFILGLKKYLLKEDLANLPVAQSRIRKYVSQEFPVDSSSL